MSGEDGGHESSTRREYVKYGSAVIGGGLLAGCSEQSETTSTVPPASSQADTTATGTATSEAERYAATLSPAGTVEFGEPPENVFTVLLHHADMAIALGHGESLNGMYNPEGFGEIYDLLLERLDGVSVDWSGLADTWNPDREVLYELDSDVHLEDPALMTTMQAWDTEDVEEIRTEIAPWFGNSLSRNHSEPPADWADQYQYYTLWEIFGKVASVFGERARYEALSDVRGSLLSRIESGIREAEEPPLTARFLWRDGIWVYPLNGPGTVRAHTRVFDAEDALADVPSGTRIDMEGLIEADPEVILVDGGLGPNWESTRRELYDDPVAGSISAVESDQVYPIGVRYGGPIMNLFQLEMIAKQLYPDQFGEWPTYEGGPYPEFSEDERLFDRRRVAAAINGDV
ncbi:ABC transporter substrate-binding protein [Halorarum halobium]|uniref:ABC transporter substrate-binding protein n=1 Tax=Halorarum halobium TaxID=3075121 RepID=UPI0028AB3EAF|nr:ABC transporter substrate-binding protein [Halobaculum sp. XH14]